MDFGLDEFVETQKQEEKEEKKEISKRSSLLTLHIPVPILETIGNNKYQTVKQFKYVSIEDITTEEYKQFIKWYHPGVNTLVIDSDFSSVSRKEGLFDDIIRHRQSIKFYTKEEEI